MPERDEFGWATVQQLAGRVEKGEPLSLTDEVITDLWRVARDMAISEEEIEAGLRSVETATALLREIARRMNNGGRRLGDALGRMYKLRDAGDLEGARQQMRDVLAVEVVPHYRSIAEGQLDMLDDWEAGRKP